MENIVLNVTQTDELKASDGIEVDGYINDPYDPCGLLIYKYHVNLVQKILTDGKQQLKIFMTGDVVISLNFASESLLSETYKYLK